MGIVNVTPDSFSDGGRYLCNKKALSHSISLINQGADIIDIGGESSRPGSQPISVKDEINRVIPVISALRAKHSKILISIDTYKSEVAKEALEAGADIINDISSMRNDLKMVHLVQNNKVPIILMHMRGTPQNMQKLTNYNDIVNDILLFFKKRIDYAKSFDILDNQIIIDPGIGFGKSIKQNFILLNKTNLFCELGYPVLIGTSRKSFLGKTLESDTDHLIEGSIASSLFSIFRGARILRVHDVKEIKRAVVIFEKAMNSK